MLRVSLAIGIVALVSTAVVRAQTVQSLTLIDAGQDAAIGPLTDGATLNLAALPPLSVRADATGVGSVQFSVNGSTVQTENVAPYALAGDTSGDYNPWSPPLGSVTISATAFSGSNATGTAGPPYTVIVTIENVPPPVNNPPVVDAGPDLVLDPNATSVTLTGTASDPDDDPFSVRWSQVGGPPATLSDPNQLTLTADGLTEAIYVFELAATDDGDATGRDACVVRVGNPPSTGTLTGELRRWHKLTLDLDGPATSEDAAPNPFRDYRLDVTFSRPGRSYVVPGYFAADGDAAESGATGGNRWRTHFAPDAVGEWTYAISFLTGPDVAVDPNNATGTYAPLHGLGGTFTIAASDKTGRDHRAQGRLGYVGERYLRFAGSGRYFLKVGADSPENFLGYHEFDNTYDNGGASNDLIDGLHRYAPHVADWQVGDPTWRGGLGKGIVGALNYLASEGMNSVYFLTMNVQGDGREVWPWTTPAERYRFDCSKLDQWEIVFEHMDHLGLMLHVLTQETENDQLLDGGALGPQRRLYYRELIARFGHHLAITWNLGEENTNTDAQRRAFARFFKRTDPYGSFVCVHTYPGDKEAVYGPLLGYEFLDGPSLQNASNAVVREWIDRSAAAGRPWVVMYDEQSPAGIGVTPDGPGNNHDAIRSDDLWGALMAGGAGIEYYFGYNLPNNDLDCEDWRSRAQMWAYSRHALAFFHDYLPFDAMTHANDLTPGSGDYVLYAPGSTYAVYLPDGGGALLDLPAGDYTVDWYDPRNGGPLRAGTVSAVSGPGVQDLGLPPDNPALDWAILVRRVLPGDTNGDCTVDVLDLAVVLANFGAPGQRIDGDLSGDGVIDATDLAIVLAGFGQVC